jgi:2-polyprenyl-3-methyl-5-hydroxy-6-metoxy-1,4-benzoquinol methylase
VERPDEPEGSFDAVVAGFIVFFMADPAAAVSRWARLLRPGGRLALSTFTETSETEKAMFAAVVEAVRPFQPPGGPEQFPGPGEETTRYAWIAG